MKYKSEVLKELDFRGFIYQCTDIESLDNLLSERKIHVYIGFDVTADSLHAGHLTQIFLLSIFQKHGHTPIILLGGGTTKIGDPTWKNTMRPLLTDEQLAFNMAGIKESFSSFLSFDGPNKAVMVNNDEWLHGLGYIDFLREFGVHFSVNKMINMETFRQRLTEENNLSFLEFNYPLLQSFDFLELNKRYGCTLQLGGSDQWANITSGVELVRKIANKTVYGLTSPLLTTSDGKKMGKTLNGAIWLNRQKLNSHDFWQYWRNVQDADVVKLIALFTGADFDQVQEFAKLKNEKLNQAKIFLADQITGLCRGNDELEGVHKILKGEAQENCALPICLGANDIQNITIIELLVKTGILKTNGEVKRLISNGGLYINDQQIQDGKQLVTMDMIKDKNIKIGIGKKKVSFVKMR